MALLTLPPITRIFWPVTLKVVVTITERCSNITIFVMIAMK